MALKGNANYFVIIPEELWEMILNLLSCSKDVQSVLAASPELDSIFQERKPRWLIEQVFPFIYHYLGQDTTSVLSCRLASKQWCKVIDIFLSDHPSRRPYGSSGVSRRTAPYPEFVYEDAETFLTLKMFTAARILAVREEMKEHARNPFLTRVVEIARLEDPKRKVVREDPVEGFVDACISFFEVLGHHIWDLSLDFGTIRYEDVSSSKRIRDKIVHFLSLLPNLRTFRISIIENAANLSLEFGGPSSLLVLPYLETIKINTSSSLFSELFVDSLLTTYVPKGQIKMLDAPIAYFSMHDHQFLNMSELAVHFSSASYALYWDMFLRSLKTKRFRCLKKIRVMPLLVPLDLFPFHQIIARFKIEELEIYDSVDSIKVNWTPNPVEETAIIPSVKFVRIQDGYGFLFEFLSALPNLEHLHVIGDYVELGKQFILARREHWEMERLSTILRCYLYFETVPETISIWNILPQLKFLTVECRQFGYHRFFREYGNKSFEIKLVN